MHMLEILLNYCTFWKSTWAVRGKKAGTSKSREACPAAADACSPGSLGDLLLSVTACCRGEGQLAKRAPLRPPASFLKAEKKKVYTCHNAEKL